MTQMLLESHTEQIYIKQEPSCYDDEDNDFNDNTSDSEGEEPLPKLQKTAQFDSEINQERETEESDNSDTDWPPYEIDQEVRVKRREIDQNQIVKEEVSCVTCSKSFKNSALLEIHLATDHKSGSFPFQCSKCSKIFINRNLLKSHIQLHDNIKPFACTIPGCSKRFQMIGKLKA